MPIADPPAEPTLLTAWVSGTRAFCQEWEDVLTTQLGSLGTSVGALPLPVGYAPGRQWELRSARTGLDVHDWLVDRSHLPAGPTTGVVIVAAKSADIGLSTAVDRFQSTHSDFWMAALVRAHGAQNVLAPGWSETWALVQGVRASCEDDSQAVAVCTQRLLQGLPVWKVWAALHREDDLEHNLPRLHNAITTRGLRPRM